jgi:hypothetical protein
MAAPSPKKRNVQGVGESDAGSLDRCDALELQKLVSFAIKNPGKTSDISAVIGLVQQGLPLARSAKGITRVVSLVMV